LVRLAEVVCLNPPPVHPVMRNVNDTDAAAAAVRTPDVGWLMVVRRGRRSSGFTLRLSLQEDRRILAVVATRRR